MQVGAGRRRRRGVGRRRGSARPRGTRWRRRAAPRNWPITPDTAASAGRDQAVAAAGAAGRSTRGRRRRRRRRSARPTSISDIPAAARSRRYANSPRRSPAIEGIGVGEPVRRPREERRDRRSRRTRGCRSTPARGRRTDRIPIAAAAIADDDADADEQRRLVVRAEGAGSPRPSATRASASIAAPPTAIIGEDAPLTRPATSCAAPSAAAADTSPTMAAGQAPGLVTAGEVSWDADVSVVTTLRSGRSRPFGAGGAVRPQGWHPPSHRSARSVTRRSGRSGLEARAAPAITMAMPATPAAATDLVAQHRAEDQRHDGDQVCREGRACAADPADQPSHQGERQPCADDAEDRDGGERGPREPGARHRREAERRGEHGGEHEHPRHHRHGTVGAVAAAPRCRSAIP